MNIACVADGSAASPARLETALHRGSLGHVQRLPRRRRIYIKLSQADGIGVNKIIRP